jgi:SAM-dependent methyltransferase
MTREHIAQRLSTWPESPTTDPTDLFRRRDGLFATDLLITAIGWLDFFNWLLKNPSDRERICAHFQIAARPADAMLTLFAAMGLVHKTQEIYRLTDLAREFLVAKSPWDLGSYFSSLKERPICQEILKVLKTDKPFMMATKHDEQGQGFAMQREEYLAAGMAKVLDCPNHHRLLDIAGALGIYACAIVAEHPQIEAAVFERSPGDEATAFAIAKRGLADRVIVIAGDMLTDHLPLSFDMHLYSHVLHEWNDVAVQAMLYESFEVLLPGGLVIIHDAHLNADKTGPLPVAEYSVFLMLSTSGRCYSVGEMYHILETIGFEAPRYIPTIAYRSMIIARKPV